MLPRRPLLTTSLATLALAGSLAAAPALPPLEEEDSGAAASTTEEEGSQELLTACDPVDGATTITSDTGFDGTVPTPVGAGNATPAEDAGLYQLDLAGLPVGSVAGVRMTLAWDTPALGDYDLVINGENALSTDDPETHSRTLQHCDLLDLETVVFTGLPVDNLNLSVEVTGVLTPPEPTPVASPTPEPEPSLAG